MSIRLAQSAQAMSWWNICYKFAPFAFLPYGSCKAWKRLETASSLSLLLISSRRLLLLEAPRTGCAGHRLMMPDLPMLLPYGKNVKLQKLEGIWLFGCSTSASRGKITTFCAKAVNAFWARSCDMLLLALLPHAKTAMLAKLACACCWHMSAGLAVVAAEAAAHAQQSRYCRGSAV